MRTKKITKETRTLDQMLTAGKEMLLFIDIEDFNITKFVEKANVGKGSFYNYFSTPYDVLRALKNNEEEACVKKLFEYYCRITADTFNQKVERMAIYLTTYINSSSAFQRFAGDSTSWYEYFTETVSSVPECQQQFIEELNTYASSAGISADQAMMNVHLLLTITARYSCKALSKKIPISFEEARIYIRKTARELFPEG